MSKSVLWRVFLLIIIIMIMIRTILITIIITTIIKPIKPTTASLWSRYIMSLIIKTLSFQNYALGKLCFQILIMSTRQKILQTISSFHFLAKCRLFLICPVVNMKLLFVITEESQGFFPTKVSVKTEWSFLSWSASLWRSVSHLKCELSSFWRKIFPKIWTCIIQSKAIALAKTSE